MSTLAQTALIDRIPPRVRAAAGMAIRARLAWVALAALIVAAPFERELFGVAEAFTVTTAEAAAGFALLVAALVLWGERAHLAVPPLILPGGVLLLTLLVAAWAAPLERGNALRFVARMAMAALVFTATASLIDSLERARKAVWLMVATATVVALVAVLEAVQVQVVMTALTFFRPGFHVVGGQLRATGTLMYPTIASMYLEVAFAAGLWLLLDGSQRSRAERGLAFAALTIIGAGIAATFTRAGLVGMGVVLALTSAIVIARRTRAHAELRLIGALAVSLTAIVFVLHSPEGLATRLRTEGSEAWYGAHYQVPSTLRLETGGTRAVEITVANTGRITWDSAREPAFAMAYHWLRSESDAVVQFDGQRTAFPIPVRPGGRITLPVMVTAPGQPGRYTLVWDVVHEFRAWLSTEGVTPARTDVQVEGPAREPVTTRMARLPAAAMRPARPQLWSAAAAMAGDRPWLGVGPDNFRHTYGRYLGSERADARVHANNMYLEILTGAGVPGLVALVWLLAAAGRTLVRRCLQVPPTDLVPAAAMLAAWVMVVGHGLVDSFLSFTPTYLTFAVAGGLAFSRAWADAAPVHRTCAPVHGSTREGSLTAGRTAPSAPSAPDHAHRV